MKQMFNQSKIMITFHKEHHIEVVERVGTLGGYSIIKCLCVMQICETPKEKM